MKASACSLLCLRKILSDSGVLSSVQATNLGGTVLLVSALLGSFAAGLPIPVIPAPLFAAGGLALFLQSKDIKDYMIFYAGSLCTAAWFLHHHFYFLDIDFQVRIQIMELFPSQCIQMTCISCHLRHFQALALCTYSVHLSRGVSRGSVEFTKRSLCQFAVSEIICLVILAIILMHCGGQDTSAKAGPGGPGMDFLAPDRQRPLTARVFPTYNRGHTVVLSSYIH